MKTTSRKRKNGFSKIGGAVYTCGVCARRTRYTGEQAVGSELCPQCWQLAGIENSISDGHTTQADEQPQIDALLAELRELGGKLDDWAQLTAGAPPVRTSPIAAAGFACSTCQRSNVTGALPVGSTLCPQCYDLMRLSDEIADGYKREAAQPEIDALIAELRELGGDVALWAHLEPRPAPPAELPRLFVIRMFTPGDHAGDLLTQPDGALVSYTSAPDAYEAVRTLDRYGRSARARYVVEEVDAPAPLTGSGFCDACQQDHPCSCDEMARDRAAEPRSLSTPADEGFAAERDRARAEWQRTHATTLNVLGVFADARPVSAQAYVTADQRDATVQQLIARWANDSFYTLRATSPLVAVFDADADGAVRREWREIAGEWRALVLPTGGAR